MKISVITVCRNSERTIGWAVESFLQQTHADRELVIVDGASTDNTLDIVRSFGPDRIRVISEPDRGIYDAMNKGLAAFSGDAVGFLNSDDRFASPDSLGAIGAALDGSDIVFGDLDFVSSHAPRRVVRRWRTAPFERGAFRRGWMPAHPTFYCRRDVVEAVGRFDLSYAIAADYDYMLRCLELNDFGSQLIAQVLVDMQAGGESGAGLLAIVQHNFEALQCRRRRLGAPLVDIAFFAKPLGKIPQMIGAG